ncbi:uncharacterized protein LOC132048003 [Lycium ferocissimum]|uniref:uncharacterized protein LOC132048003 n=1 Tax=Lycium ferocissimum TaxID=112874 RepID=UPI0028163983|nr:uncharacterized protein LOC132048003 [Lycium ferocissimum]
MASSTVNYPAITVPSRKCRIISQKPTQIRAQSNSDEGRSWHAVDAHLQVLRERIEKVKIKESLERSLACKQGWNYYSTTTASTCFDKNQKKKLDHVSQSVEFFCMVCGTLSFTILGCTLCLYLTSILVHLSL